MRLLAIDPGSTHSAYVLIDTAEEHPGRAVPPLAPIWFDKIPNKEMLELRHLHQADQIAIEQIGHYGTGMPAGKTVFDTCIWIGRFWQEAYQDRVPVELVLRATVKTHLCGMAKAKDGNVVQALVDRFAAGKRNHGKGIKNDPGWFYGFHSDIWQSYALAVYYADTRIKEPA